MALHAGSRLGPYEIEAPLGAGGMGEVYRARDTRLDRAVAIKVLPPHVASDPRARDRFDREARTISQLDHPHICAIHDIGQQEGLEYLVLEYLQGETLAQRLARGPLPLDQTFQIAREIADALDAAHRQHIVHRDLKPGNIMLTRSGTKLLDFGLAKEAGPLTSANQSLMPTAAAPLTAEGTILGTLQYMAPEQLEGREADTRTDVFAFGTVLYEMVTGRRAFEGQSQASLIAAILEHHPPALTAIQPLAPGLLDRLVKKCLEKDPDQRWQNVQDLALALRWITDAGEASTASTAKPRSRRLSPILAIAFWAMTATVVAGWLWMNRGANTTVNPGDMMRFVISGPQATANIQGGLPSLALSHDGSVFVYVGTDNGVLRLYRRRIGDLTATAVPGTDGASVPFLAPDGRTAGFTVGNRLRKVSLDGGAPVTIAEVGAIRGASWAADDTIIFSTGTDSGLLRVPASGGTPQPITQPDVAKGERSHRWPYVIPGRNAVVYTIAKSDILSFDDATIVVRDLATNEERALVSGGSFPIYSSSGHLLYARGGALLAVALDSKLNVVGPSVTVLNGVVTYPATGAAEIGLSHSGLLLSIDGGATQEQREVVIVDRQGRATSIPFPPATFQVARLSPDGRSLAMGIDNANAGIWIGDPARATTTRLTLAWSNNDPFWSPDGSRIAFTSGRGGVRNLFWQATDGRTAPEQLTKSASNKAMTDWSRDGRYLAFNNQAPQASRDVYVLDLKEGRREQPVVNSQFDELAGAFSPDGKWIAYVSDESGAAEVYLQGFPAGGRKHRVSRDGGVTPRWSRDGRELYYWSRDAMMAVQVSSSSALALTMPRVLFRRQAVVAAGVTGAYDVMPDGRLILIATRESGLRAAPLTVTINWQEALRRSR